MLSRRELAIAAAETIVAEGGATMNVVTGQTPSSGYAVSIIGNEESFAPNWGNPILGVDLAKSLLIDQIYNYLSDHWPQLTATSERYFGAWVNDDTCYFDVTDHVLSLTQAIDMGYLRKQVAIYDFNNHAEIILDTERYETSY